MNEPTHEGRCPICKQDVAFGRRLTIAEARKLVQEQARARELLRLLALEVYAADPGWDEDGPSAWHRDAAERIVRLLRARGHLVAWPA